eukprot:251577_1
MADIDTRCGHSNKKYKSCDDFCKHLEILRRRFLKDDYVGRNFFDDLANKGYCRNCSVIIASNLVHITDYRQFHFDTEGIEEKRLYFINCLQYLSTANFIFNQSELWVTLITYVSVSINDLKQRQSLNLDTEMQFHNIAVLLFQIVRSIGIMKKYHWKLFCEQHICLIQWMGFVESQLKSKLFLDIRFGKQTIFCIFVLITFTLQHLNEESISIMREKYKFKGMKTWFLKLKDLKTQFDLSAFEIIKSFHDLAYYTFILEAYASLEDQENVKKFQQIFQEKVCDVHRIKWNNMQCHNMLCIKKRHNGKKFYKCRSCRVTRYCSRLCQKHDWNENNHKRSCRKLTKIRENNKKQKKIFLIQRLWA